MFGTCHQKFGSQSAFARLGALAAVLFLTACGGGGASSAGAAVETPYDEIIGAYGQLAGAFDTAGETDEGNIPQGPDAGHGIYTGNVKLALVRGPIANIAGDILIDVDFASTQLTGSAGGFYANDGKPLTVVDAQSNPQELNRISFVGGYNLGQRPDYPVNFDLTGNLLTQGGVLVQLDVGMNGDFIGPDAAAIGGIAGGQAIISDNGTSSVVGDFIAAK